MNLTAEQKDFLKHHKIDEKLVFDANGSGLVGKELKQAMYNSDTLFAVGTNNCKNGHKIKTRSGHCPVCDTERIAYTLRVIEKEAYIYVVGSIDGKIIKVGFTTDLEDRLFHLNKDNYGGFNDWKFLYHAKYKKAGSVEIQFHSQLDNYNFLLSYNRSGKEIKCYELFKCGYAQIKEVIGNYNKEVGLSNIKDIFELENAQKLYNFGVIEKKEKRIGEKHVKKNIEKKEINIDEKFKNKAGKIDNDEFGLSFEKILINNKKYIKADNGYIEIVSREYIGGKFDRIGNVQKIGNKYYFVVFKDISDEECLCGIVSFDKKEMLGNWFDSFYFDLDEYDGEDNNFKINYYLISGNYFIKFSDKLKDGFLNLETGKVFGKTFDRIFDIKEFYGKYYFIVENDSEIGIYSVEKNKMIGPLFSEVISYFEMGGNVYVKIKDGDEFGYINLNKGELSGDIYEEVGDIQEKDGVLYFSFSYFDGSYGLYDITNDTILNNTDFSDIKTNNESNDFNAKGLKIKSGFDNIGNTETINGKQYMPVQIGTREGIYCHTDKMIIGDLYDQIGYTKTSYGEYKNCDINKYGKSYYFTVKNGWKYGDVNLETGEFTSRGLLENIINFLLK